MLLSRTNAKTQWLPPLRPWLRRRLPKRSFSYSLVYQSGQGRPAPGVESAQIRGTTLDNLDKTISNGSWGMPIREIDKDSVESIRGLIVANKSTR